jgi:hypothetical protein
MIIIHGELEKMLIAYSEHNLGICLKRLIRTMKASQRLEKCTLRIRVRPLTAEPAYSLLYLALLAGIIGRNICTFHTNPSGQLRVTILNFVLCSIFPVAFHVC